MKAILNLELSRKAYNRTLQLIARTVVVSTGLLFAVSIAIELLN